MIGLSRRMFLKRGSMAVAMAGVATSIPLLSEVATGPPASEGAATASGAAEGYQMTDALVAHVQDLASGEIKLFLGEREMAIKDPALARALFQATR